MARDAAAERGATTTESAAPHNPHLGTTTDAGHTTHTDCSQRATRTGHAVMTHPGDAPCCMHTANDAHNPCGRRPRTPPAPPLLWSRNENRADRARIPSRAVSRRRSLAPAPPTAPSRQRLTYTRASRRRRPISRQRRRESSHCVQRAALVAGAPCRLADRAARCTHGCATPHAVARTAWRRIRAPSSWQLLPLAASVRLAVAGGSCEPAWP